MKYLILTFFTLIVCVDVYCQHDTKVLFGNVYRNYGADLRYDGSFVCYELFKQDSVLYIDANYPIGQPDHLLVKSISNPIISKYDIGHIPHAWSGINYSGYYYSGSDVYTFQRIDNLPYEVIEKIHNYSQLVERNLLKEFLDFTVHSVCTRKLEIFDVFEGKRIGCLVEGDLLEVLERLGEWVRVRFLKTDDIYWTYLSCIE